MKTSEFLAGNDVLEEVLAPVVEWTHLEHFLEYQAVRFWAETGLHRNPLPRRDKNTFSKPRLARPCRVDRTTEKSRSRKVASKHRGDQRIRRVPQFRIEMHDMTV